MTTKSSPYRLGTQTGSIFNHLMSAPSSVVPVVGMGCTILCWTDRHAATIVEVSANGKKIAIVEDISTRVDKNGMSDSQEYEYSPGSGQPTYYTLRRNGAFVRQGDTLKGTRVAIGFRKTYHDFSF